MRTFAVLERLRRRKRPSRRQTAVLFGVLAAYTAVGRLLGYGFGTSTIVRCRDGHLFTTIWIPGVNLKALDLGVARVQRCPVGRHWTLVVPVRAASLNAADRALARSRRDVPLP
jgi:hypothetical protein